jgi:hypothetical protein
MRRCTARAYLPQVRHATENRAVQRPRECRPPLSDRDANDRLKTDRRVGASAAARAAGTVRARLVDRAGACGWLCGADNYFDGVQLALALHQVARRLRRGLCPSGCLPLSAQWPVAGRSSGAVSGAVASTNITKPAAACKL